MYTFCITVHKKGKRGSLYFVILYIQGFGLILYKDDNTLDLRLIYGVHTTHMLNDMAKLESRMEQNWSNQKPVLYINRFIK